MYRSLLLLSLCTLAFIPSVLAEEVQEEILASDPLMQELLDNQSQTSLESVDFGLSISPQIVNQGDVVTYTFTILNRGSIPIENARISHMLPLGLTFLEPEEFVGNLSIESMNGPNDTAIFRDLYLADNMEQAFVLTLQAYVNDWSSTGLTYNQAVLDVFTAVAHETLSSDANLSTETNERTSLNIQSSNSATSAVSTSTIAKRTISTNATKSTSGSGKAGVRWAGMKREDLLKGAIGATQEQSKAFVAKLNESRPYQVKTYVDRNGSTKYYGIVKGKKAASDFATTTRKTAPISRSSRTGALTLRTTPTATSRTTTIRNTTATQREAKAVQKNLRLRGLLRR